MKDSTERFSSRVENYIKYRPSYPRALIRYLVETVGLEKNHDVADIGSGTGILTRLLLDHAKNVYAVEPNKAMRMAAEQSLGHKRGFHSIDGTAEQTTLEDHSIDHITAAQAFHWFDIPKTKTEFQRILKKDGKLILIWNNRINNTPFLQAYETGLKQYATDYNEVNHQNLSDRDLAACFDSGFTKAAFENHQEFNLEGVIGRLESSSYAPLPGTDSHDKLYEIIMGAFEEHAKDGKIRFNYSTEVYWGNV